MQQTNTGAKRASSWIGETTESASHFSRGRVILSLTLPPLFLPKLPFLASRLPPITVNRLYNIVDYDAREHICFEASFWSACVSQAFGHFGRLSATQRLRIATRRHTYSPEPFRVPCRLGYVRRSPRVVLAIKNLDARVFARARGSPYVLATRARHRCLPLAGILSKGLAHLLHHSSAQGCTLAVRETPQTSPPAWFSAKCSRLRARSKKLASDSCSAPSSHY
jgi:hypothetical protein